MNELSPEAPPAQSPQVHIEDTATTDIIETLTRLRRTFAAGQTRPEAYRRQQLRRLRDMLCQHEDAFVAALHADFRKPACETYLSETDFVRNEIDHTLDNLRAWMTPEAVHTNLANQMGSSEVRREPLGVALIIGPWNFPVQLALNPLVGAIAGGNCAIIKPSELTAHTAALLGELLPKYLDPDAYALLNGGVATSQALLAQRFDKIFFTGGGTVGRVVMRAAAEHLTPVTLELGGKSPCIVDDSAAIKTAARRIAWGKAFNAGQVCVAPDYILVHHKRHDELVERIGDAWREFFGSDPSRSADYARIVNERHFDRLVGLLEGGGRIAHGGGHDREQRFIEPTLLTDVDADAQVMQEEIFGPILPVLRVDDLDAAIEFVNARPHPLALYFFSKQAKAKKKLLDNTQSGDVAINEVITHYAVPDLPFGGVGESGMGGYHGRNSFDAFTYARGVLSKGTLIDPAFRYPPFGAGKIRLLRGLVDLG